MKKRLSMNDAYWLASRGFLILHSYYALRPFSEKWHSPQQAVHLTSMLIAIEQMRCRLAYGQISSGNLGELYLG